MEEIDREGGNQPVKQEKERPGSIHLEFGIHREKDPRPWYPGNDGYIERLNSGDNEFFFWEGIKERLSSYSPDMLVIDSLIPYTTTNFLNDYPDYSSMPKNPTTHLSPKTDAWYYLPARPRDINKNGEVLIVAGDVIPNRFEVPRSYWGTILDEGLIQKERSSFEHSSNEEVSKIKRDYDSERVNRGVAFSALGLLASAIVQAPMLESKEPLNRRQALKKIGRYLGGISVGALSEGIVRNTATEIALRSPNEAIANIAEEIADLSKVVPDNSFIDGRTALLISKMIDAKGLGLLPESSEAAVIMGNDHIHNASKIMENREFRMKLIGEYYKDMRIFLQKACDKLPNVDKRYVDDYLDTIFTYYDILSVSDSGEEQVENINEFTNRNVKYVNSYSSNEIREAINLVKDNTPDQTLIF